MNLIQFQNIALRVLNKHTPVKQKHIRFNQSAFRMKEIRVFIITCSKLLNKFCQEKINENKDAYNKQRNLCVGIIKGN